MNQGNSLFMYQRGGLLFAVVGQTLPDEKEQPLLYPAQQHCGMTEKGLLLLWVA